MDKKPFRGKLAVWFLITGAVSFISWNFWGKKSGVNWSLQKTLSYTVERKEGEMGADYSQPTLDFARNLERRLLKDKGNYAVAVYRLNEQSGYGINEKMNMPGVSIMKVPIMAAALKAAETGTISLEQTYRLQEADKQQGSGPLEYYPAGTQISIGEMLEAMGKKSDNTAPGIIVKLVGEETVVKMMADLGMKNTDWNSKVTTAEDLNVMWKKLAGGEVLNSSSREKLWEWLSGSIYEERIPAGVPEGKKVVHKVGTGDNSWADTGIVDIGGSYPLIITILNREIDFDQAGQSVPEAVKMIWDFESSRH